MLFLFLLCVIRIAESQKASPCPSTFSYKEQLETSRGIWAGEITLRTVEDLTGVFINVVLDRPAESLGSFFGEVTTADNREYVITNTKYNLEAGPAVIVEIFVRYNTNEEIPSVKIIRLNGKTICTTKVHETYLRPTLPTLHISQPKDTSSRPADGYQEPPRRDDGYRPPPPTQRPERPPSQRPGERPPSQRPGERPPSQRPGERPPPQRPGERPAPAPRPLDADYSVYGTEPSGGHSNENDYSGSRRTTERYNSNDRDFTTERHTMSRRTTERHNNDNEYSSNRRTTERYNSNNHDYTTQRQTSPDRRTTESNESNEYQSNRDERSTERNNPRTTRHTTTRPTPTNHNIGNALENPDDSDSEFFIGDFGNYRPTQSKPRPSQHGSSYTCGTVATQPSPLISNGQGTVPGQWPWHAALYHSKGLQLVYTCGGTLVSLQHIVTAAHCVAKPRSAKPIDTNNIIIYLGKYDLISFGTDVQDRDASEIFIHPSYNYTTFFNDIAVLKLSEPAHITNFVKPCCLWEDSINTETIVNKEGTVVGWGFDQNKKLSNKLMQAQMPVVSSVTCIYSNRDFFSQFTFENNFCAGFRNGTSVCNGDSGGGMVFPKRGTSGQNTVWQLRGIVSVGVALQGSGTCDTSHYVVFTDAAKYTHWIRQLLD
ncbi:unnamed protein product [Acanthoscelides obtectus]|uniref:Peptidase S1 domain-containing protein n=1 Tax=Acanthoscelides obtectus TaxID=200917 RepID=A0A9P0LA26_ACAOB|nr:unnamed protein product [Acanthoscelides obtectus]CAK1662714.1 hypothetical protein AOBTE_LOCUS23278 [Acanthoscelides obtectus]